MRCGGVGGLIDRYVDGRLDQRASRAVERHLASCARCARRAEAARALSASLAQETAIRAPAGLAERIMNSVYREALRGRPAAEGGAERAVSAISPAGAASLGRSLVPAASYRRLGLSFLAAAAILAASLFVPSMAYSRLIRTEKVAVDLAPGRASIVKNVLDGAGIAARGALHPASGRMSETNGGMSR
jgi:anti-sigma factor RsiW